MKDWTEVGIVLSIIIVFVTYAMTLSSIADNDCKQQVVTCILSDDDVGFICTK